MWPLLIFAVGAGVAYYVAKSPAGGEGGAGDGGKGKGNTPLTWKIFPPDTSLSYTSKTINDDDINAIEPGRHGLVLMGRADGFTPDFVGYLEVDSTGQGVGLNREIFTHFLAAGDMGKPLERYTGSVATPPPGTLFKIYGKDFSNLKWASGGVVEPGGVERPA